VEDIGVTLPYLPKKSEFTNVSKEQITRIQNRLNHRPRKILGYKTPHEVFFRNLAKELVA
jgi:IS30 family transposase